MTDPGAGIAGIIGFELGIIAAFGVIAMLLASGPRGGVPAPRAHHGPHNEAPAMPTTAYPQSAVPPPRRP